MKTRKSISERKEKMFYSYTGNGKCRFKKFSAFYDFSMKLHIHSYSFKETRENYFCCDKKYFYGIFDSKFLTLCMSEGGEIKKQPFT